MDHERNKIQLQGLVVGRKSCWPASGRPFTLLLSLLLRPGRLMFLSQDPAVMVIKITFSTIKITFSIWLRGPVYVVKGF